LLGDVYYRTERYAEAVDEYQAALRLDPGNNLARRGVERASKRPDPTAAPGP
jgi:cytochrome c-type biogenesis protein CcmH/NrfG